MSIDEIYFNFWGKPKPKFTEMELALMEGGHSLGDHYEEANTNNGSNNSNRMQFLKGIMAQQMGRQPK